MAAALRADTMLTFSEPPEAAQGPRPGPAVQRQIYRGLNHNHFGRRAVPDQTTDPPPAASGPGDHMAGRSVCPFSKRLPLFCSYVDGMANRCLGESLGWPRVTRPGSTCP